MAEMREAVDAAGFQKPAVFYDSNKFSCCTTSAMIRQYFFLSKRWWDKIYGSQEAKSKNCYAGYAYVGIVKISSTHDRNSKQRCGETYRNKTGRVWDPVQDGYTVCVQLKEEEEPKVWWILQACQNVSRQENKSESDGRPWRICPSSSSSCSCLFDWDQSRRTWLHDLLAWPIMSTPDLMLIHQRWWKASVL